MARKSRAGARTTPGGAQEKDEDRACTQCVLRNQHHLGHPVINPDLWPALANHRDGSWFFTRAPFFMITANAVSGVPIRAMSCNGLPSTRIRSASAPVSITPIRPGYGLRSPDKFSSDALVEVAMVRISGGVNQRVSLASWAPCRFAALGL